MFNKINVLCFLSIISIRLLCIYYVNCAQFSYRLRLTRIHFVFDSQRPMSYCIYFLFFYFWLLMWIPLRGRYRVICCVERLHVTHALWIITKNRAPRKANVKQRWESDADKVNLNLWIRKLMDIRSSGCNLNMFSIKKKYCTICQAFFTRQWENSVNVQFKGLLITFRNVM